MTPQISHRGWTLCSGSERDGDGFETPDFWAENERGEIATINHSRFHFNPTPERFAFLVDNGFPPYAPGAVLTPWTDKDIDGVLS